MQFNRTRVALSFGMALAISLGTVYASTWNYDLTDSAAGPNAWGNIAGYETCGNGQHQSPIDIADAQSARLNKIDFHYNDAALNVVNNGHTIQVNVDNGSTITIGNESYRLLQFHFHSPSEHTKNSHHYPMEVHFVHVNNAGVLAVVGAFISEGHHNEVMQAIWDIAPHHEGTATATKSIKQRRLLGKQEAGEEYFNYSGSLTTPPCTENVRWHVVAEPIEASADQIEFFVHLLHEGHNNRPVQNLNGRELLKRVD